MNGVQRKSKYLMSTSMDHYSITSAPIASNATDARSTSTWDVTNLPSSPNHLGVMDGLVLPVPGGMNRRLIVTTFVTGLPMVNQNHMLLLRGGVEDLAKIGGRQKGKKYMVLNISRCGPLDTLGRIYIFH